MDAGRPNGAARGTLALQDHPDVTLGQNRTAQPAACQAFAFGMGSARGTLALQDHTDKSLRTQESWQWEGGILSRSTHKISRRMVRDKVRD